MWSVALLRVESVIVEMGQIRRRKIAWLSYLGIQVAWLLCILLVPVAFGAYPSKYWAISFCLITVAGGVHLICFRGEYDHILRKAARVFPYARWQMPAKSEPKYLLPIGVAYSALGVASALLVALV